MGAGTRLADHNLARLGLDAFARHGDRESLYFEGSWYRSGALFERAWRLAAGLRELGVAPGDRVVVMMPNSPDVGVAYQAIWRAGAVVTPVLFLLQPPELRALLADSEARAVITSPEVLDGVLAAAAGVPSARWVIATGPAREGVVSLAELEAAEPLGAIVPRADDDLAALGPPGAGAAGGTAWAGFEVVGVRKRLGRHHGRWCDVVLIERRSPVID